MLVAYFGALRARGNILRALQRFLHLLGESVDAQSGETYEVRNPANGEVVDTVPKGNAEGQGGRAAACRSAQILRRPGRTDHQDQGGHASGRAAGNGRSAG